MALEKYLLQRQKYFNRLRRELAKDVCEMLAAWEGTTTLQSARGYYADPDEMTSYDDPYATVPMPDIRLKRRSGGA